LKLFTIFQIFFKNFPNISQGKLNIQPILHESKALTEKNIFGFFNFIQVFFEFSSFWLQSKHYIGERFDSKPDSTKLLEGDEKLKD